MSFRVYLQLRAPRDAEEYALAVSTPGHPLYGKFLSPTQFTKRFGPTSDQVEQVQRWLHDAGFTVGQVPANRKYVQASGTLTQVQDAFQTSVDMVMADGKQLRANTTALSVPVGLEMVQAVMGIDQSEAMAHPNAERGASAVAAPSAPGGAVDGQPCSSFWGEKNLTNTPPPVAGPVPATPSDYAPCGYTPAQLRRVYGIDRFVSEGYAGAGVRVAVVGVSSSPTLVGDVNTYSQSMGLPRLRPDQLRTTQVTSPTGSVITDPEVLDQWHLEQTMDVEAIHAMAPDASISYYGSSDDNAGLDAVMNDLISNRKADIISSSYSFTGESLPRSTMAAMRDLHIQAAAEGISVLFASGDAGDETGGSGQSSQASPDWPASSDFVTAVGATSLGIGRDGNRVFERGWETGMSGLGYGVWSHPMYTFGSGGGTSRIFTQPSYQAGVVPSELATAAGQRTQAMRVVPDLALVGDPSTGMLVGETMSWSDGADRYGEFRGGGTSLATPLLAGMLAVTSQRLDRKLGLLNPALYAHRSALFDVTPRRPSDPTGLLRVDYLNGVNNDAGVFMTAWAFDATDSLSIHTRPGYDDVTGLGAPQGLVR